MSAPRLFVGRVFAFPALSIAAILWLATAATAQEDDMFGSGSEATDAAPADGAPAADPTAAAAAPAEGEAQQQQQLTQEDVQRMLKEGEEALKTGDFATAMERYDLLIRVFKQQFQTQVFLPIVYTGRGQAFVGQQDLEAALADFKAALDQEPNHTPALVARGKLYMEQGATDLALADFQLALEQERRNVDALFGIGKAYVLLGGPQQAIKPLTAAITADDQNAEAYRLRAQAYAGVGKNEEAHADVEKSLSINPDDHETYIALATILLREEKFDDAVQALEDAIQRYKPKDPESKEPFAQGYLTKAATILEAAKAAPDEETKQKAYEAALAECDKLLELTDDSPVYAQIRSATEFRRGAALRLLGRYGDAITALTEAINLNPDLAEAYFKRGICFYNIGEDHLAVLDFKHAGNIEYTDPRPRLWEGFAYAKLGEYHEAIRCYGQALVESDRYVPAYVNRGLAYMMLGENDKALADFNAAVRLEPAEWTHYFKRGMVYERMGDNQKAADSFVNAIRFFDKYPPAYRHAADNLTRVGRGELAREYRSKAAELEAEHKKAQDEATAGKSAAK